MDKFINLKDKLSENNVSFFEENFESVRNAKEIIRVEIPVEREKVDLYFRSDDENLQNIIDSQFFKYKGIMNYEAIWSEKLKNIECEIVPPNKNIPSIILLKRLKSIFGNKLDEVDEISDDDSITEIFLIKKDGIEVTIGSCSIEFAIISMYKEGRVRDLESIPRFRTTLKIKNVTVETHDKAFELLEKISNSIFFQVDLIYDYPIMLGPQRENYFSMIKRRRPNLFEVEKKEFALDQEYDQIPLCLYWFGKTSQNLPIFQYLAYYQALEYYFSIYSIEDVKINIRNLVKDPRFNIFKDGDVIKLLNIIKTNKMGGIGEEKEQLLTTLKAIIDYESIWEFVNEDSERKDYFSSKGSYKISSEKLLLNDATGLVNSLGKRIYDIRCRIVHNKASEIDNKLMPFTKEVKLLKYDIDLLEFVVRKILISNSKVFPYIG